jgi:hypothetical protein
MGKWGLIFSDVPVDELAGCCYWEYARESAFIRDTLQRYREWSAEGGKRDKASKELFAPSPPRLLSSVSPVSRRLDSALAANSAVSIVFRSKNGWMSSRPLICRSLADRRRRETKPQRQID